MKINRSLKNWLRKWRMYIFIVVAISVLFTISLIISGLSVAGILMLANPMIWYAITLIIGILIVVFGLIIIGYLLLMTKPKGGKK